MPFPTIYEETPTSTTEEVVENQEVVAEEAIEETTPIPTSNWNVG